MGFGGERAAAAVLAQLICVNPNFSSLFILSFSRRFGETHRAARRQTMLFPKHGFPDWLP